MNILLAIALTSQVDWAAYHATTKTLGAQAANVQFVHCRESDLPTLRFAIGSFTANPSLSVGPRRVGTDLYLLDLQELGWLRLPKLLAKEYPFRYNAGSKGKTRPAIIEARWFVQWIFDQTVSKQAQNELIWQQEIKTEADLLKLVGANEKAALIWMEDNSGVAVQKIRRFHAAPTSGFDTAWYTRDFERIDQQNDPLENLLREDKVEHDASEVIYAIPKVDATTGDRALAMGFALFNGGGEVQFEAPANIVTSDDVRGPILRSSLSCHHCHTRGGGLLPGSVNSLQNYIRQGGLVDVADGAIKSKVQALYLANLKRDISNFNEGYKAFVAATFGGTPAEASAALMQLVAAYDSPLTLEQAAAELYVDAATLERAIRKRQIDLNLPARVTALVRGVSIPRDVFEDHWTSLYLMLKTTK